jgi:NAD(P)-dependent dehydrogenase (short-subunit alcohol dehydrogenase family)
VNPKRTAIVTGAASGIGRAASILLAEHGVQLVLVDSDQAGLASVLKHLGGMGAICSAVNGDVSDESVCSRAALSARNMGAVDFLFNNAGVEFVGDIEDISLEAFKRTLEVNVVGYFLMAKACIPFMKASGFGCIVNNSSDAGIRGMRHSVSYAPSKAAVVQLTRSLCMDLGKFGIRVNCICPGAIKTPLCDRFNEVIGRSKGISGDEAQGAFVHKHVPLQRIGQPSEVAELVWFLMSDRSSYINGAVIPVDGGLTCGF